VFGYDYYDEEYGGEYVEPFQTAAPWQPRDAVLAWQTTPPSADDDDDTPYQRRSVVLLLVNYFECTPDWRCLCRPGAPLPISTGFASWQRYCTAL